MKNLFEYVRDNVLHGMPSGCLATKDNVDFDIGMWQHKSYDSPSDIYGNLRGKWTPHTVNLVIVDDLATIEDIKKFVTNNGFEINQRNIYNVYCIAVKTEKVDSDLENFLKTRQYPFNNYRNKVRFNEYTIFVCDFVKNLLLY